MPKFTFRQLEYFRAIAMNGSISAASEQERISRSALAAALDELERSLECQLFIRQKSHGMVLTASGEQVLGMAHELLQGAQNLETSVRGGELADPGHRLLRLAGPDPDSPALRALSGTATPR